VGNKPILVLAIFLTLSAQLGCMTNRQKRFTATGAAFIAGVGIGSASAPSNERKELHAVYWGALLGLGTALLSQEIFSDEYEAERLALENQKLNLQLDLIQNANTVLLKEGKGYFKSPTGEELFTSGKARWRLYQIDKWTKSGPNQLYHQDKMVELLPLTEGAK
jgi:hypothetical protein